VVRGALNVARDAKDTLKDFKGGDTTRGVAGTIDTSVNFAGKTPLTFAASAAFSLSGGARGVVDRARIDDRTVQIRRDMANATQRLMQGGSLDDMY
jgi:hypothetical protein